jgi:hypothetical protein
VKPPTRRELAAPARPGLATGREEFCCAPECTSPPSPDLDVPLCGRHARSVYSDVASLLRRRAGVEPAPASRARPLFAATVATIYFAEVDGLLKIGFSTHVERRLADLGGKLIASGPGTMHTERAMHARFGPWWVRGEYFRLNAQTRALAETSAAGLTGCDS